MITKKMKCMYLAFCNTIEVKDTWNAKQHICPHFNSFQRSYKYLYRQPMWLIDELLEWSVDRYVLAMNDQPLSLEFFIDHVEEINLIYFLY